jgi:Concanavalin A-like lectin/glucanases superfamily
VCQAGLRLALVASLAALLEGYNPGAVSAQSSEGLLTAESVAGRPTAAWSMNEASGPTMFDAVGDADGTLSKVLVGAPGYSGTAYQFNGFSSYVSVPSSPALAPGSNDLAFTIHVKTGSLPTRGDFDVFRRGTSPGDFYKLEILQSGQAFCQFRGDKNGGTTQGIAAGPALADRKWHAITCTKTSTRIAVIVDGTAHWKLAAVGGIADTDRLIMGAHPNGDYFKGFLDEASITIG